MHRQFFGFGAVALCLFFIGRGQDTSAQRVGLVLSGGSARGLAHIGVIKALEENGIPIDYIAGTSMGALVGGMYAIGMTPQEMEAMAVSERFIRMATGGIEDKYRYYFKQKDPDASWLTLKFTPDTVLQSSLPSGLIYSVAIDYEMMTHLSAPAAAAHYDFDSLFVPYRCVAADVEKKEPVIFREGNLNEAMRASISFPFYLRPITVEGKLLFDGGLYNNFPADVMYDEFLPDLIIGSNVSYNAPPPGEDDVLSQIRALMMSKTDFSVKCDNGIIIQPEVRREGQFNFDLAQSYIDSGYAAALRMMEQIRQALSRRTDSVALQRRRQAFRDRQPRLVFENIYITGLNRWQSDYVRRVLSHRKYKLLTLDEITPGYYRLFGDDKIRSIFPTARYNRTRGVYDLYLRVKKEREITLDIGGVLSSGTANHAFLGAAYNYLGSFALKGQASAYYGRLYGSAYAGGRMDFPVALPFYLEGGFTVNRWDYYKSRTAFFEDVKPSYLVKNDRFGEVNAGFPLGNNGRMRTGAGFGTLGDEYYQTKEFISTDTADRTDFNFFSAHLRYEKSTLNRKDFANSGSAFSAGAQYIQGRERTTPGSTSANKSVSDREYEWFVVRLVYDNYYKNRGHLRLGFYAEAAYSTQPFFSNYTASILRAPAFYPTQESKTLFIEAFHAHQYGAVGKKVIWSAGKNLDLRLEGYLFQPYRRILAKDGVGVYGGELERRYFIAAAAAVYHTPVGPLALTVNYYHDLEEMMPGKNELPLSAMVHFGYLIFNRGALE